MGTKKRAKKRNELAQLASSVSASAKRTAGKVAKAAGPPERILGDLLELFVLALVSGEASPKGAKAAQKNIAKTAKALKREVDKAATAAKKQLDKAATKAPKRIAKAAKRVAKKANLPKGLRKSVRKAQRTVNAAL